MRSYALVYRLARSSGTPKIAPPEYGQGNCGNESRPHVIVISFPEQEDEWSTLQPRGSLVVVFSSGS